MISGEGRVKFRGLRGLGEPGAKSAVVFMGRHSIAVIYK